MVLVTLTGIISSPAGTGLPAVTQHGGVLTGFLTLHGPLHTHCWEKPKLFFEIQLLNSLAMLQGHDRELYGFPAPFTMPYVKTLAFLKYSKSP